MTADVCCRRADRPRSSFGSGEENRTLATGLLLFTGGRTQELELTAAGTLIMIAPVIVFFLLFQRQFIRGLTSGAVKG